MHKQWLDRPFTGSSPLDLIRSIGWIHAPGCATPYLSLWARMSGFRAGTLDRLVFRDHKLIPLETLRGAAMLVPAREAAVAIQVGTRTFTELAEQAEGMLPLTRREMERLKSAVIAALESGAKSEDRILDEVPSKLVREFPSTLRRIGMTGSLRVAINLLKEEGRIVKIPDRKHLDSAEASYVLLSKLLPDADPFALKPELANAQLAALYFRAEGPARIKDFAWWSGLQVTEAIRAAGAVGPKLCPVRVTGVKDEFLISESDMEEFAGFEPATPVVNFIPFRDVYLKGQREIARRFTRPEHADKPFARLRGRTSADPLASILHNGEVVGIWEWSTARQGKLDFVLFDDDLGSDVLGLIRKRASKLQSFIRNDLGKTRNVTAEPGTTAIGIHGLQSDWKQSRVANAGRV